MFPLAVSNIFSCALFIQNNPRRLWFLFCVRQKTHFHQKSSPFSASSHTVVGAHKKRNWESSARSMFFDNALMRAPFSANIYVLPFIHALCVNWICDYLTSPSGLFCTDLDFRLLRQIAAAAHIVVLADANNGWATKSMWPARVELISSDMLSRRSIELSAEIAERSLEWHK